MKTIHFVFRYVAALLLACVVGHTSIAQNQFLSTFDYSNVSVQDIANIPNVNNFSGNTAYDQNHRRLFCQGSTTNSAPWTLYTIDAVSGAVIYSVSYSTGANSTLDGFEYDNANNILYALYFVNSQTQFCKIDPTTGQITIISNIPPYNGFTQTTYDTKDHLYIVSNGNSLLGIDALTGIIINNLTGLAISNIVYDNLTDKLYGIKISPVSNPQFDSVSLSTGTLHLIADLPPVLLPLNQTHLYTIDEHAGKYIFVGTDAPVPGCIKNYLYVLDVNTGAVLLHNPYPWAQAVGIAATEYVVNYRFDNSRGTLYALHWKPTDKPVAPMIKITASANPACAGSPVTFTASSDVQITNPDYQWLINGFAIGNGNVYTNDHINNGDIVQAVLLDACTASGDSSNRIVMSISGISPTVSIISSISNFCSVDTVLFTATPSNIAGTAGYQWQLNGENVGTNSDKLLFTGIKNGDVVHCIMSVTQPCTASVTSNDISPVVKESPLLLIGNDTVIAPGNIVALHPSVVGAIISYQWTPSTYLSDPSIINPVFTAGNSTTYQLSVIAVNGCIATGKISITVYRELRMPNVFTPNGDGHNDIFRIPASARSKIKSFSIFNRWGQMIFKTSDSGAAWDGSFHGQSQPTGSYIWMIEYENPLTKLREMRKGVVMLIR